MVKQYSVCGDCAAPLLASGGALTPNAVIELGRQCQLHPGPSRQATNLIDYDGELPTIPPPEAAPPRVASLTGEAADDVKRIVREVEDREVLVIATKLLVAWSTEERGVGVELYVEKAVQTARKLVAAVEEE